MVAELRELNKVKKATVVKQEQAQTQPVATGSQANVQIIKDLAVSNLTKPWKGDTSDIALGCWSDNDKIKIISFKLQGPALASLNISENLQASLSLILISKQH